MAEPTVSGHSPEHSGGHFSTLAALAAVYFLLPGHPQLSVHGVPLGPAGTVLVSAIIFAGVWLRSVPLSRLVFKTCVVTMLLLCVARVAIGRSASPGGWLARYYANDHWAGSPEWSSDFPRLDGTRIDPAISFKADTFPAHYLNNVEFNRGTRRETSEPMSVEWSGFTFLDEPRTERWSLTARGAATFRIDDRVAIEISSLAPSASNAPGVNEVSIHLAPGPHKLLVRYTKPADVEGLIELTAVDAAARGAMSAPLEVTPIATDSARGGAWPIIAARAVDAALSIACGCALFLAVDARPRVARWRVSDAVTLGLFGLFGIQGWWKGTTLAAGRVVTLSGGDDWFGFESNARDVLHHGPLMTLGQPPGQVYAYFSHPFYSYFLAGVHAITGEGLFGPLFVQFLILAIVAVMVFHLAADMFGEAAALAGVLVLVVIMELDFARYYTVTLLSENLYILTVTLALVPFIRWIQRGASADLVWAAFWGGMSSITRPAMMTYFVPALALVLFVSFRKSGQLRTALLSTALVGAIWSATIAPVTLRNWFVAHRLVLISDGLGPTFVQDNIPANADPRFYEGLSTGGVVSGIGVLARMTWDYPGGMLRRQGEKLGFSLGMVQWLQGFRPHPELVAVSSLYVAMFLLSPRMRSLPLWPVHLFVLSHLAAMGLTNPSNYGYRLILPPYVYTSTLSVAAAVSLLTPKARQGAGTLPAPGSRA